LRIPMRASSPRFGASVAIGNPLRCLVSCGET
jgi:hypothetical protein